MIEIIEGKVFLDGIEFMQLTKPQMEGVEAYVKLLKVAEFVETQFGGNTQ